MQSIPHETDTETSHMPATGDWRHDRGFWFICAAAILLGLFYNGAILKGYGPDELRHMKYVELLLNEHQLPYVDVAGNEHAGAHSLHPPLYYCVLLPFYALFRGLPGESEWHLVRVVSLALCIAALPLIYQIAMRAGNADKNLARLAVAQVALLPIFGMTAGTINNDSATFLAVTAFLWLVSVRYADERNLKSAVVLGVCFGIGGLCKATALLCNGAALVIYFLAQDGFSALRSAQSWKRLSVVLLLVALIAGPWYGRNIHLYGQFTPIAPGYTHPGLPNPQQGALVMMMHDNFPMLFAAANWSIFSTLWSQKDWIPEAVRGTIYLLLSAYCLSAVAGTAMQARRKRPSSNQSSVEDTTVSNASSASASAASVVSRERIACWPAYGALAINWLACLSIALFVHWGWAEGGRYLLPALTGVSLFLARGWRSLIGAHRLNALAVTISVALVALNSITIYWLLQFLNPTFGKGG